MRRIRAARAPAKLLHASPDEAFAAWILVAPALLRVAPLAIACTGGWIMTANAKLLGLPRSWTLLLLPLLAISAARLAAQTEIAADHPRAAALLLVWIVADSLMLSFMARIGPEQVERKAALAVLAVAMATAALVMPAHLRMALLSMPVAAAAMTAVIVAHVLWGVARAKRALGTAPGTQGERIVTAASELVSPALARFALAEARLLDLALFRWNAAPDLPDGSAGFGYHKHLTPIFCAMLALQLVELGVVHLLVSLWSAKAALVLSILSVLASVYLIGLLKSFRLRPVLIDDRCLRVRTGILIDRRIALANVAGVRTGFGSERVKRKRTLDAGLLAWPNILVELKQPMLSPNPLQPHRVIDAIAFRLDEPAVFARLLEARLRGR